MVLTRTTTLVQVSEVLSQEDKQGLQLTHSFLKSNNWGPVPTAGGTASCLLLPMPGRHLMEVFLSDGPVVGTVETVSTANDTKPNAFTHFGDTSTSESQEPDREVDWESLLPQSVGAREAARAVM